MLEAVTRASWLVQAITEPLCNQLVVELYGRWGNKLKYDKQPYNFLHQRDIHITVLMGQNACALRVCCLQLQKLFRSVYTFVSTVVVYYINYYLCI